MFSIAFSSDFTANNLLAICHLNFLILSFLMAAFYEAVVSQLGLLLDIFLFLQLLMAFPLLRFLSLNDKLGFNSVFVLDFFVNKFSPFWINSFMPNVLLLK